MPLGYGNEATEEISHFSTLSIGAKKKKKKTSAGDISNAMDIWIIEVPVRK